MRESGNDLYSYDLKNIIRIGLEITFSSSGGARGRPNFLSKLLRKSISPERAPGYPHGLHISSEKTKTTITLENKQSVFTAYAPKLFGYYRSMIGVHEKTLLDSLCNSSLHSLSGKSGKSGMTFFVSEDRRFIIKTLTLGEKNFLLKILKKYVAHFHARKNSLLSQFIGVYKVTQGGLFMTRTIFIVMNNVFGRHLRDKGLEKFDLKGTTEDRFVKIKEDEEIAQNSTVKKDINFGERKVVLSEGMRALITDQVRADAEFLERNKIMDYSLLVGIKQLEWGPELEETYQRRLRREENLEDYGKELVEAIELGKKEPEKKEGEAGREVEETEMKEMKEMKDMKEEDVGKKEDGTDKEEHEVEMCNIYRQFQDGLIGEEFEEDGKMVREFYALGIIDFLQPYNLFKKTAHQYKKQVRYAFTDVEIDTVNPKKYFERFVKYINRIFK